MSASSEDLAVLRVSIETELRTLRTDIRGAVEVVQSAARDINRETEAIRRSTSKAAEGFQEFRNVARLLAGSFIVQQLKQLGSQALEFADNIDAASNRLGFNVEELQRVKFAAGQLGVEFSSVDVGIKEFQRRIGEIAATGKGELSPVLQALGVNLRDQNGQIRDSAQLFDEFLKKLGQVEDQTVKVALAQKAFGRGGADLLQIVGKNADEFDRLKASADIFTADEIKQLDDAGDAIERLQNKVTILTGKLIVAAEQGFRLAKEAFDLAFGNDANAKISNLTDEIQRLQKVAAETAKSTSPSRGEALAIIDRQLDALRAERTRVQAEAGAIKIGPQAPPGFGAASKPKISLSGLLVDDDAVKKQRDLLAELESLAIKNTDDAIARASLERAERIKAIEDVKLAGADAARARALVEAQFAQEVAQVEEELADKQKAFLEDVQVALLRARDDRLGLLELETAKTLEELDKQNLSFEDAQQARTDILEAAAQRRLEIEKENAEQIAREREKQLKDDTTGLGGARRGLRGLADDFSDTGAQIEDAVVDAFGGAEDALTEFVTKGKLDFTDLANSIINDIVRISIRQAILKPLAEGVLGGLEGGGGSGGSGLLGSIGGFIGGLFSSGAITGAAAGGATVKTGDRFLVGELGPEIFQATRPGRIIPNGQGGGGDTTTVNNSFAVTNVFQGDSRTRDGARATSRQIGRELRLFGMG